MRFDVLTLFPDMLRAPLQTSILGRAVSAGGLEVGLHDIRDYAENKHKSVDDAPFGGGAGMVMQVEPVCLALEALRADRTVSRVILLSPSGAVFDQSRARKLATQTDGSIVLICGRYEGIDARIEHYCDEELSIGDFVLSGGELAALVIIDAVTRLVPGVLGNADSPVEESLEGGVLEYPHFTRPREFRGREVPEVLLGGNHAAIARWRRQQSLVRTRDRRPDLFERLELSKDDRKLLKLAEGSGELKP